MANISIDQLRALPDAAKVTKWDITFLTLPAVGLLGGLVTEQLNVRCESVEFPKGTMENFEIMIRGHKIMQSGKLDMGNTLTLTFFETVDNTIMKLVEGWKQLAWSNRQGRSVPKQDMEATLLITLLDSQDQIRAKTTVYGCIYNSDDLMGTLDGSTSDAVKPSLTLNFDFFVTTPLR